ncbi:MAG: erythromycin esterase family protein [Planctomycetota bacterium]|jgi:erythromycin esterase
MKKYLLSLIVLVFLAVTSCQETIDSEVVWLKKNAIKLHSIDPINEDFSDLAVLKKLLKNVDLILLGEESHGDGTTFLAKSRMIKFLHQEMGFNVLVFESGMYDCYNAWQLFTEGTDIHTAFRRSVWGLWSESQQVQSLIDYVGQTYDTGQPLELAGFDNFFIPDSVRAEILVKELRQIIDSINFSGQKDERITNFLTVVQHFVHYRNKSEKLNEDQVENFASTATELACSVESSSILKSRNGAFWARILENLALDMQWSGLDFQNPDWALVEQRDMQMARNLLSLMRDQYPGQKCIVWAASLHIARNLNQIEVQDSALHALYQCKRIMGDVLWKELHEKMYSLAFTAFEGEFGVWAATEPTKLEMASPNSLEDLLVRAGYNNAIIDFRKPKAGGKWLKEKLKSRPLGYTEMMASWNLVFDGILFTRVMMPSTKAGEE